DISSILQQIQQGNGSGPGIPANQQQPQSQTIQAPVGPPPVSAPSRIELILSDRAGLPLHQFGYDLFAGLNQISVPQVGSIQGYYVLGPGDELQIALRGQENASYDVLVDNDGNVSLPKLPPIRAAGRTFSDFQASLQSAVKQAYISTNVYVSVGQLRRVSVTVAGEVNAPGVKQATGLSTPLDALVLALGVKKSGSLRNIRVVRGGRTIPYDLYHVLLNDGSAPQVLLQDGDRIVVPTLGKVAAVSGWVRRPGIYELGPGQSAISLQELLRLGGGLQVRGNFRYSLQTTEADGRLTLKALPSLSGRAQDGDILFVEQSVAATAGRFEFFGPTSLAGEYSLSNYRNLSDLLRAPGAMGESPYMLLGLISRKDPKTLQRHVVAFAPAEVRDGKNDIALQSEDIVRVFDRREAALMTNAVDIYVKKIDFLDVATKPSESDTAATATSAALKDAVNAAIFAQPTDQSISQYAAQSQQVPQSASAQLAAVANAKGGIPASTAANLPAGSAEQNVVPGMQGQIPAASMTNGQTPIPMQRPYGSAQAPYAMVPAGQTPYGVTQGGAAPDYAQRQQGPLDQNTAILQENSAIQQATAGPFTLDQRTSSQGNVPITSELVNVAGLGQQIGIDPVVLISFLADHRATLNGAVRDPGTYLIGGNLTLAELVEAAGGPQKWTDLSKVSLLRVDVDPATGRSKTKQLTVPISGQNLASIDVQLRDNFRFNPVYTDADQGTVVVQGEVRFPGAFDLTRGERLSEVLQQAGGLTQQAYPYGAVFLRKSAAQDQKIGFERAADDIQKQLMMAVAQGSGPNAISSAPTGEAAAFLQGLVQQLHNTQASGRITVIADPATLATHPEDDIVLQPGDFLYIPQRPDSVTVVGEVLNPGSYPQKADLTVDDYIELAGGYGRYADDSYVYVVNPDGSSKPVQSSLFHFGSDRLAPGSLIVVPRDLRPLDWRQFAVDISKILSDLAVSAASISIISRN
ncbi:MAG TPA: SLBB domain-containing protein, partial [Rhizomicrobium sp.]|nr:SLBB domain-containing protein [Rhizomicrobium sp.]